MHRTDYVAVLYVVTQTPDLCSCMFCRTNAYPETPTPIKWDFYNKNIQKKGFVGDLMKQVKWIVFISFCLLSVYVCTRVCVYSCMCVFVHICVPGGVCSV